MCEKENVGMKKERRTVSTSKLEVVACSPMAPFPGMKTPFPGMKIDPESQFLWTLGKI